MTDFFKDYHPLVNSLYFASVILITMFTSHPILQIIGFTGSVIYLRIAKGNESATRTIVGCFVTFLLIVLLNPLVNHQGVTILFYLSNGNPITLESIIFGLSAGLTFVTAILWFASHNVVMTSDKLMYIYGKITPSLALVFSMSLRFVPLFKRRLGEIQFARSGIVSKTKKRGFIGKLKESLAIFSAFVSWILESSVETADSMRSRGFGLGKRTSFSLYKFTKRDATCLIYIFVLDILLFWMAKNRLLKMVYYPAIKIAKFQMITYIGLVLYFLLCLLPSLVCLWEELRWKYFR